MSEIIVKPLEWDGDEYVGWTAYGVGLGYSIDDESGEEECFVLTKHDGHSELKSAHASFAAASEFAQADYTQRILSAIDLEATKAEIAARDAALAPFARMAEAYKGEEADVPVIAVLYLGQRINVTVGDLRAARAALNASEREA